MTVYSTAVDVQLDWERVRSDRLNAVQRIRRFTSERFCGLDYGGCRSNAGTLQKSAAGNLYLGSVCHKQPFRSAIEYKRSRGLDRL